VKVHWRISGFGQRLEIACGLWKLDWDTDRKKVNCLRCLARRPKLSKEKKG
jgi:hypothetical protein